MENKIKIIESDITIVGAGMAGITAALTSARLGMKVTLINDRAVIGGNHSSEHRVHYNSSARNNSYYARENGIADELKLTIFKYNHRYNTKDDYQNTDMALLNLIYEEENIGLFLNTYVNEVKCDKGKIEFVIGEQMGSETRFKFISPLFVDNTGDGYIAYKSGANFSVGREAKNEFCESLAPIVADDFVMGSCILFKVGRSSREVKFVKPPFAYDYKDDHIFKYFNRPETGRTTRKNIDEIDGIWWLSYGGMLDTIKDSEDISLELKKLVYGYWDYVKNSGKFEKTENLYLKWIANNPSKRESRRFDGGYKISQVDIENRVEFHDAVCSAGWSLDIHDVGGIYGNSLASEFGEVEGLYQVPYRISYSKDIENLYLGGRILSATHIALGSLRVMETLSAVAQGIGTSAYLCKKYDINPSEVYSNGHIPELQKILQKNGQYIHTMKEDVGLAKSMIITASSEKKLESVNDELKLKLDNNYCITIPVVDDKLKSFDIKVENLQSFRSILKGKICIDKDERDYKVGNKIKYISIEIEGGFSGIKTVDVNLENIQSKRVYLVFDINEDISTFASYDRVPGMPSFNCTGELKRLKGKLKYNDEYYVTLFVKNINPSKHMYSPLNVTNGYSRPMGHPNCWVSDGKINQFLRLKSLKPIDISEIQVYFNAQFETDNFSSPIRALVKDYNIKIMKKNKLVREIEVRDNYLGVNYFKNTFENIDEVVFEFKENYGSDNFEVYTVKIF